MRLGELLLDAGLPDGVFNVVTGLGETAVATLANHDDVDKLTFTGSTEVGRILVRASAGNLEKALLELGGKSPNIASLMLDLEVKAQGRIHGHLQGEICSAGSRLFIERGIYDEFIERPQTWPVRSSSGTGSTRRRRWGRSSRRNNIAVYLDYVRIGLEEKQLPRLVAEPSLGELQAGFFVEPTAFAELIIGCALPGKRFSAR